MPSGSAIFFTAIILSLTRKPIPYVAGPKHTFVVLATPFGCTQVTVRLLASSVIPTGCSSPRVTLQNASIFVSFAQACYHWDATASVDSNWLRLLRFLMQYAKGGDDKTCFPNASPCLRDSSLGDTSSRVESKIFFSDTAHA